MVDQRTKCRPDQEYSLDAVETTIERSLNRLEDLEYVSHTITLHNTNHVPVFLWQPLLFQRQQQGQGNAREEALENSLRRKGTLPLPMY